MRRLILALVIYLISSCPLICQGSNKTSVRRYPSPDRLHALVYQFRGEEYGKGPIYVSDGSSKKLLFNSEGNYIPQIKWLSANIVSIRIYCGNPCWFERYYNTTTKVLSPEFEYSLATQCESGLVAHVGAEPEILVSEMFSGKVRLRYKPTPKRCGEFLFFYRVKFIDSSTISIKCSEQAKVIQIPAKPPLE